MRHIAVVFSWCVLSLAVSNVSAQTGGGLATGLQQSALVPTQQGTTTAQGGSTSFLSRGTGFLSSSTAGAAGGGQASLLSGITSGIGRGVGGGFGGGGFGNTGFQTQAQGQTATTPLRIPMRIGFAAPPIAPTALSAAIQSRLTRVPGLKSVAATVVVRIDGRTAVLGGAVPAQQQKDLIGRLLLLEPGVAAIRNELQVAGAESLPTLQQP